MLLGNEVAIKIYSSVVNGVVGFVTAEYTVAKRPGFDTAGLMLAGSFVVFCVLISAGLLVLGLLNILSSF